MKWSFLRLNSISGKIIKGIAGFYYISCGEKIYECKAKGNFRNKKLKPLVGDNVIIEILDDEKSLGNIIDILERKNEIIRPALSNIDLLILILAVAKPSPALDLLDKYLISMKMQNIKVAIVWNKVDLDRNPTYIEAYRKAGYENLMLSAKNNQGIDELLHLMKGKSVALAGPSGVGKSTITNLLIPSAKMETGDISRKIERGKHTTRHSEFFVIDKNTFLCDTPGFTSISIEKLEADDLKTYYPEFYPYEGKCKFNACTHTHEPSCAIKEEVKLGNISELRYESYKKNYEELKLIRRY